MLETERLVLRRWEESDAENLFQYAKDPDVGPIAGWPPHQSVEESLDVIRNVFNGPEAYAICLKKDNKAIGAIELKLNGHTDMTERDDECELGYWLGKPFWGQGIVPEAAREMLRHAFEDIGMQKVWCGYYDGNLKSKRVQEKCGFRYQWTTEGVDVPLMHEERTGHVNLMTKDGFGGSFMKQPGPYRTAERYRIMSRQAAWLRPSFLPPAGFIPAYVWIRARPSAFVRSATLFSIC